jgi:nitrate/nitrite-specific signal transduction histidine kinase
LLRGVDSLATSFTDEINSARGQHLRGAISWIVVVSGLALAAGIAGAIAIGINITRPLKQTAKVLEEIGRGDLGQRVPVTGNDEVAMVAASVNRLAETLQSKRELESSLESSNRRLENMHQDLMVAARRAGMAEIATGVLHNVGNVLNSVNVSTAMIRDQVNTS